MSEPSSTPPLPLPLHNRVAIITGGSRGIGRAISLHLASLGANLVINFLSNSSQANQLVTQINSNSSTIQAICFQADISEPEQVKALFDAAESAFNVKKPHILVNSAGVADPKYPYVANMEVQDFEYVMKVNVKGVFLCCQEASKRIKNGGGGRIVCLSSSAVAALRPGNAAYAASKAAVEAMIKIFAKELKGTGITANCVAPGPVASEMFFAGKTEEMIKRRVEESPLGRLGQPDDIAPLVGFLASDVGEWVNGQIILANGGYI